MKHRIYIRCIGWLVTLLLAPISLLAKGDGEGVRIIPTLERSAILIGEQVKLNVKVVYPRTEVMRLVLPEDTLVSGVEIIESQLVDSTMINDRLKELVYDVVITSFDSANYQLRNISALVGDSLYTANDQLSLVVNTVPVDLDHPDQYSDIKGQWKPPFVWQDYLIYLYILLGLIALGVGIFFLVRYLKNRRKSDEKMHEEVPLLDPYQEAILGVEALKSEELWQQNRVKEYYTRLTDILRRYIFRVYGITTLDMTSSEILEAFKSQVGRDKMYSELARILETADLAKFAKFQPVADENISLLSASVAFIEAQRPAEEPSEDVKAEEGGAKL
ncbi:hypothetical protein [uncultured Porphyromonas sp.]|uniref:hypothetical protein n=1 Tax=uncultured Porphyromonas sp. TaxID=159274 RepID=UPI002620571B|nr:hypothetical protein [uncultured Porphyromonas sp.]